MSGLYIHELPDKWSPLEGIVLVKCLDEEGSPSWAFRTTPGLNDEDVQWQTLHFGSGTTGLDVEVPVLSAAQMTALALRVRQPFHLVITQAKEFVDLFLETTRTFVCQVLHLVGEH